MGFIGDIGHFIMVPLYYIISAVLLGWHKLFTVLGLDPKGGLSWALSIIGLTLVIRAALIPLFVKQIKSSRNMQMLQPKVKELQKKYGHDRQKLAEETMKLYREAGTNPFASCLPILLQMPIFFALFRLLSQAAKSDTAHGFLTREKAHEFGESQIFGSLPINGSFWQSRTWGDDPHALVMIVAAILVLAMTATTFTTQRQLMAKNMPAEAMSGPYAQQQKMLLYILPVAFGLGGVAFPIGVLLYWTTSNLWTMGQQFYVIRNNPAPGTPAFEAKVERDKAKAARHGHAGTETVVEERPAVEQRPSTRQQPKRQSRSQRKGGPRNPQNRPGGQASTSPTAGNDETTNQQGDTK